MKMKKSNAILVMETSHIQPFNGHLRVFHTQIQYSRHFLDNFLDDYEQIFSIL